MRAFFSASGDNSHNKCRNLLLIACADLLPSLAALLPDDFKKYFERFGKVLSAEVMFNRETQKSRGFGFIVFDSEEAVERVLRQPTHIIDGKMVRA